jgi:hypothetical protein
VITFLTSSNKSLLIIFVIVLHVLGVPQTRGDVSQTFGKLAFKLCQKERVALLRHSWTDGANGLNDRSEIHGLCRHTARFHRLCMWSGTDDPSLG